MVVVYEGVVRVGSEQMFSGCEEGNEERNTSEGGWGEQNVLLFFDGGAIPVFGFLGRWLC